ncbi:hypothetical protein HPULCUR_006408 [Helicostylum pulchrum]|uniref:F-box domain-containing protein n=1 Tax=Helicostylum pulchrum TaxID=562976 RepID=A0ABP9Y1U2_9FUNG
MVDWYSLPNDILLVIFRYLEEDEKVFFFPERYLAIQSRKLRQCQLTCKTWYRLLQNKNFRYIILRNQRQIKGFVSNVLDKGFGPLVKHIVLDFEYDTKETTSLLLYFSNIFGACTGLKRIYIDPAIINLIWNEPSFDATQTHNSNLELVPSLKHRYPKNNHMYHTAACLLHSTLRELLFYIDNSSVIEKVGLEYFTRLRSLYIKFSNSKDVFTVGKIVKNCSSVMSIELLYEGSHTNQEAVWTTDVCTPIYISPYIKQLLVKYILYDTRVYSYLMQTFPCLVDISLRFKPITDEQVPMLVQAPTDVIIKFIRYLINIPTVYVPYIPILDLGDFLVKICDNSGTIKYLSLRYKQINEMGCPSYIAISSSLKEKEKMNVGIYYKQDEPVILPRIGLIKQSGNNLKYLKVDMGMNVISMKSIVTDLINDATFSDILTQCPNLQTIYIRCALLYNFGTSLQHQKKLVFNGNVGLYRSLINYSFLSSLSFNISYISTFTMESCQFIEDNYDNTNIAMDMPDTKFVNIIYSDYVRTGQVYLKLVKTADSSTFWFVGNKDYYEKCNEREYEISRKSKHSLSLFIRCKDVTTIDINAGRFSILVTPWV